MSQFGLLGVISREVMGISRIPRQPEPQVMDESAQVDAYTQAGRELGIMAPTYLFHSAQAIDLIRPGDRVIDLACGPGTQLAQLAQLAPDAHFIGVDLSEPMLDIAERYLESRNITNAELRRADITSLSDFPEAGIDVVVSSMSLHHLPSHEILQGAFKEMGRILKPGGGIYLGDFGRLRSEKSMRYFAYRDDDRQPDMFTRDYYNSLRAAFSVEEFHQAYDPISSRARIYHTFAVPFLIAIRTPARSETGSETYRRIQAMRSTLPPQGEKDLRGMERFFRKAGLDSHVLRGTARWARQAA